MIYKILKNIISASLILFYKSIVVEGKENIPDKGPLIIAANHPNTFMDPLLIAAQTQQRLGFVANAGIFRNKFMAAVLRYLHVIPIFRKKDVREGEVQDNSSSFAKCIDYLSKDGSFMIFPEGSSFYELKLRQIKTGTARIAFDFQERNNFNSGLQIITVALNYSDAIKFRSKVMITFNEPISIDEYRDIYDKDPEDAVLKLTDQIREELEEQLVITNDEDQEILLRQIQKIYAEYWVGNKRFKSKDKAEMEVRKALSRAVAHFHENEPEKYEEIKSQVQLYFNQIDGNEISENFFSNRFFKWQTGWVFTFYIFSVVLGFPIYLLGYITHFLPFKLAIFFSKIPKDIEYRAPILMGTSIFLIPIFYTVEIWAFHKYFQMLWLTLIFGFSLPFTGSFVLIYQTVMSRFKKLWKFVFIAQSNPDQLKDLIKQKKHILSLLENARKEYSANAKN